MHSSMKKCPSCAEEIKAEAEKCRYCGTNVRMIEASNDGSMGRAVFGILFLITVAGTALKVCNQTDAPVGGPYNGHYLRATPEGPSPEFYRRR